MGTKKGKWRLGSALRKIRYGTVVFVTMMRKYALPFLCLWHIQCNLGCSSRSYQAIIHALKETLVTHWSQ
jgi:hypothetical protein